MKRKHRYMIVAFAGDNLFNDGEYNSRYVAQLMCWLKNRRARLQTMDKGFTWFEAIDRWKFPA